MIKRLRSDFFYKKYNLVAAMVVALLSISLVLNLFLTLMIFGITVYLSFIIYKYKAKGYEIGLLLCIALTPLMQSLNIPVIGPKLTLSEIIFAVTFILFFIKMIRESNFKILFSKNYNIFFIAFIFVALMSISNIVTGKSEILDSVVEIATFAYLWVLFIIAYDYSKTVDGKKKIGSAFLFSALIVICFGIIGIIQMHLGQTHNSQYVLWDVRLISVFRNPNQLGAYCVLFFPIFLIPAIKDKSFSLLKSSALILISLLILVCLYYARSQAANYVFIVEAAAIVLYLTYNKTVKIQVKGFVLRFPLIVAFVIIAVLIMAVKHATIINHLNSSLNSLKQNSEVTIRQTVWDSAFKVFRQHPLIGGGFGDIQYHNYWNTGLQLVAHNSFVLILGETGILGFLCWIFLGINVTKDIIKIRKSGTAKQKAFIGGVIIGLIGLGTFAFCHDIIRYKYIWVLIALIASIASNINQLQGDAKCVE